MYMTYIIKPRGLSKLTGIWFRNICGGMGGYRIWKCQVNLHLPGTAADVVPAAEEPLGELKDFIFHNRTCKREVRPLGVNK